MPSPTAGEGEHDVVAKPHHQPEQQPRHYTREAIGFDQGTIRREQRGEQERLHHDLGVRITAVNQSLQHVARAAAAPLAAPTAAVHRDERPAK